MSAAFSIPIEAGLSELPKLATWYKARITRPPTLENPSEFHIWTITKAMQSSPTLRFRHWASGFDQIIESTSNMLAHVLETDELAITLGVSLPELYGFLAESAIHQNEGLLAFQRLKLLADKTHLAAFRFLAAWTAFNCDDLDLCVAECEKVHEPFAPIHTLLGQALLEAGKTVEAIESLKVAIQITRNDPLPLVQLIKAYLVVKLESEAMRLIEQCRTLVGHNLELECLAAMTILSSHQKNKDFSEKTLAEIYRYLHSTPTDIDAFAIGIELSTHLNLKDWATRFSEVVDFTPALDPGAFARSLAKVLKKIGERHWYDLSGVIIDKASKLTQSVTANAIMQ
jgi:tetratricopeptide (TPR) repeat protein